MSGRILIGVVLLLCVVSPPDIKADGPEYVIDRFIGETGPDGLPEGWTPLTFSKIKNHTLYFLGKEGENSFVKAESRAAASGIYKKLDLDPRQYPVLLWRWRIDHVLQNKNERTKGGDDYAARLYVTFRHDPARVSAFTKATLFLLKVIYGEEPPGTSLIYVWAAHLPKDETIESPYTDQARIIAVESGSEKAGQWVTEERSLYRDYKRVFGEEPPRIAGVALMTDTDNTEESATAYYDDIVLTLRTQ